MLTEDQVLTALRTYLLGIMPRGVEVIQGQANRVPEPLGPDFLVFWPLNRTRLATNTDAWALELGADEIASTRPTELQVQVDAHGPKSADLLTRIEVLWRDDHACRGLADSGVQPLYGTDPRQMPFINGEGQYENRWMIQLALQANLTVSTPMDFATTIHSDIRAPVGA